MSFRKLNEQIESMLEDGNNQLSFTKDVRRAYNKARLYVKRRLQQLIDEVDSVAAVDLYDIAYDLLNDINNNIRDHVAAISDNFRKATKALEEHPEEIKQIEALYGKAIYREIEALNQKLGE